MTTDTRTYRSALVGWCDDCHLYTEPYVKGQECPSDCERETYRSFGNTRIQRKRRVFICDEHEDHPCFFTKKETNEHDCFTHDGG